MRLLLTWTLLLLLLLVPVGAREAELLVGSELDFPPLALGEAGGPADGFTVDL